MLKINHINVPWKKNSKKLDLQMDESLENHGNVEILYILSGKRIIYYDDGFYEAVRGDVFFIMSNIRHSASSGDRSTYRQLWLWPGPRAVWGAIISREKGRKKHFTLCRKNLDPQVYCPWVSNMLQKKNGPPLPDEKLLGLSLLMITDFLNSDESVSSCSSEESIPDKQRANISDICQYMEICSGAGLTVSKLAKIANYSPTHFARLFRLHTGITVHDWINQLKKKKMEEMERKKYSVKEIAQTLGFSNSSAFCVWRKNLFRKKNLSGECTLAQQNVQYR